MTGAPTVTLLTADDLLNMPDDGWNYELDRGRLIRLAPASWTPGIIAARVLHMIQTFLDQHRLGVCAGQDTGFVLATDPDIVRAPDVAFVRQDRIPPAGVRRGYFPGPPDLAIEIRSPNDRPGEILRKIGDYLDAGTPLVWYLDPERRSATVYRQDGSTMTVGEDGVLDGEDVLPGFTLSLADIWV